MKIKLLAILLLAQKTVAFSINLGIVAKGPTFSLDENFFKENDPQQGYYGSNYYGPTSYQTAKPSPLERFVNFVHKLRFPWFRGWNPPSSTVSTGNSFYTLLSPVHPDYVGPGGHFKHAGPEYLSSGHLHVLPAYSEPAIHLPSKESSYTSYTSDALHYPGHVDWAPDTKQGSQAAVRRKRSNAKDASRSDDRVTETSTAPKSSQRSKGQRFPDGAGNRNQLVIITKTKSPATRPTSKTPLKTRGRTPKMADGLGPIISEAIAKNLYYPQTLSSSIPLGVRDMMTPDLAAGASFLYPQEFLVNPSYSLKQQMLHNLLQSPQVAQQTLLSHKKLLESEQFGDSANSDFMSDLLHGDDNVFAVNPDPPLEVIEDTMNGNATGDNEPLASSSPSFVEADLPLVERETQLHPFITRFEQFAVPSAPSVESVTTMHKALLEMMNNLTKMIQASNMSHTGYGEMPVNSTTSVPVIFPDDSPDSGVETNSQSTPATDIPNTTASYNDARDTPKVNIERMLGMVQKMMQNMEEIPLSRETTILMQMLDKLAMDVFNLENKNSRNEATFGNALRQNVNMSNTTMKNHDSSSGTMTRAMEDKMLNIMREMQNLRNKMKQPFPNLRSGSSKKDQTRPAAADMLREEPKRPSMDDKGVLESMLEQILKLDGGLNGQSDSMNNLSSVDNLALVAMQDEMENYSSLPLHMQTLRLPLSKTNILKLVIEAHLLNRTTNSSDLPRDSLRPGPGLLSLIDPDLFGRHFGIAFGNSNDERFLNATSLSFDPSIGGLDIGSVNNAEFTDSFNLTSLVPFDAGNSSFSRICHMCVNIFQSPQSLRTIRNSSDFLSSKDELRNFLKQRSQGAFETEEGRSPKVSITQVNYAGRRFGPSSQSRGWIPSAPTWLQGVAGSSLSQSSLQGRVNGLPLFPPLSRKGEVSAEENPAISKTSSSTSGSISFPTNKPFTDQFQFSSTQINPSFHGRLTKGKIRLSGPFGPVSTPSTGELFQASEMSASRLQSRRYRKQPSKARRISSAIISTPSVSKDNFSRSLTPDARVSWPRPNFNYQIW